MITFEILDAAGRLQALHDRRDGPAGKRMSWRSADGSVGLGGRRVDSLPMYGSERVMAWPSGAWIVLTEGESDCDALTRLDVPALGTVTGATAGVGGVAAPTVAALADVAPGRRFVCWPDNDDVGRAHMTAVAANLYRAGARDVRSIAYKPTVVPWPKGAGARDLIGGAEPISGAFMVAWFIEEWSLPVGRPGPLVTTEARPSRPMGDTGSVSDALIACGVLNAKPGRTVRCPAHDDRHASLSVLRDDRRAVCKSGGCPWSGRGVTAADVLALVPA